VNAMRLEVLTPTAVLLDVAVSKVIAEAPNGLFCLLPRHVDFVAALVPAILYYTSEDGREHLVAVDEGCLVKFGEHVRVSTLHAVAGVDADRLQATVTDSFLNIDDDARRARSALARLESGAIHRLVELERQGHG